MSRRDRVCVQAVIALVVLLGAGNIAQQVLNPLPSDGVRWDPGARGLVARTTDSSGIQRGDHLLRIDGLVVRSPADLMSLNRVAQPGDRRYYEVERSGEMVGTEVEVHTGRVPRRYLFLALIGLVSLAAAARMAATGTAREQLATAAATAFAVVALASPVGWLNLADKIALSSDLVGRLLFAPLLLHTVLCLSGVVLGIASVVFLYVPSVAVGLGEVSFLLWGGNGSVTTAYRLSAVLDRATDVIILIAVGLTFYTLRTTSRRSSGAARSRAVRLLMGLSIGLASYVVFSVLPGAFGVHSALLADLSLLPLIAVPLAFSEVIAGPLVRLEELARGGLIVGVSGVTVGGLVLAAGAIVAEVLSAWGVPGWIGYVAVVALVAAGFIDGARTTIECWIEAHLDQAGYAARRSLVQLGRELAVEPEPTALARVLLERLRGAFRVDEAALYGISDGTGLDGGAGFNGDTGQLRLLWSLGDGAALPTVLTIPRIARLDDRLYSLSAIDDVAVVGALERSGLETVLLLRVRDRVVGLLSLGPSRRGALSRRERQLLVDLGGYVAIALDHARLRTETQAQAKAIQELEQFRANVVESLPVGILIVDLDGVVLSANQALSSLLGCPVVGRDRAGVSCTTVEDLPAVVLDPPPEGRVDQRSIDDRLLALTSSLLRRTDGTVQGRIIVVEDVTIRVAEERDRARREKLATVGMLSAGIAHEVNTPLTGIASYVQMMLATTAMDDPRRLLLQKTETQAFRAARMVRNFLNYARPGDGVVGPVDLNAVAASAVALLDHETRRARARIDLDLDAGIGLINGRDGELEQVALNVIKNALDALDGGGTLRVSTGRQGNEVFLRVKDDGVGMSPGVAEHIFDPFFTTKHRDSGHGLGLHIAYGIVKSHDGDIRVDSVRGHGTTIEILLPASPVRVASGGGA